MTRDDAEAKARELEAMCTWDDFVSREYVQEFRDAIAAALLAASDARIVWCKCGDEIQTGGLCNVCAMTDRLAAAAEEREACNTMTKVEDFGYLRRMAECADRGCMWCRESMKKNEEVQPSSTAIIEDALQILVRALHGHDDHRFDGVVVDALKALRWSENDAKR